MDRWGLTLPLPGLTLAEHEGLVKRAEAAGYTDLWTGETAGPDGFTPLALSAAWTERARLGTGIVGVFQRGPALLAQQAAALADASEGRFVLGIGSSSDRIVEGWNGIPFEKPLSKVRETLDFLDRRWRASGPRPASSSKRRPARGADRAGGAARQDARPRRRAAAGAFTNFLPLAGLPKVTAQLQDAPTGLRAALPLLLHPRRARAGRAAGPLHVLLLHHRPGLRQLLPLARLRRADRADGQGLGSRRPPGGRAAAPWELIEDMFIFGTPEQMKERLDAFVAGGITLPILTPIVTPDKLAETIEALAPA